ncbi:MAG: hypothetical protein ACLFWB_04070 [Armatimonadota bacterium]
MSCSTRCRIWYLIFTLAVVGVIVMATPVAAEPFQDYYEYRFSSGLPGNNAAVAPGGHVGIRGAAQMAIPVAYTPSKGTIAIDANNGMARGGLTLDWHGPRSNGTLNLSFGLLEPGRGLYAAYMCTSDKGEPAYNLQYQLRPEDDQGPAVAVGVLDLVNQRASTLERPFAGDARSFYVVATREFETGQRPLFATFGYGTDRFDDGPFAGLCYQVSDRFSVSAEYDGLGTNACFNYSLKDADSKDNFILFGGIADMDQLAYGLTYTSN